MRTSAREKIRQAAIGLFAEQGYAATTTRQICDTAGVTKPLLYYHFENKERLYREIVLDACNESRKQLRLASQGSGKTRQKLIGILAAEFEQTKRNPKLSMMFLRMVFPSGEGEPLIDCAQVGLDRLRLLAGVIDEGIRRGDLKGSAQEIAEALIGIQLIYSMSYILTGSPRLDGDLARRIVNLLFDGCNNSSGR